MRSSLLLLFAVACYLLFSSCTRDDSAALRRADVVFARAKAALARGDHLASRVALQELLLLETSLGRTARRAETALLLADNYTAGADFDSAFILCEEARRLYNEIADRNGVRAAIVAQAHAHRLCGDDAKAYALLAEELRIEEALGMKDGARELRWRLLAAARAMSNPDAERGLIEELRRDAARFADTASLARLALAAGAMFSRQNLPDSALGHFQRAAALAERADNPLLVLEALMHSGILADRMKKVNEAYRFFAAALRGTDSIANADRLRAELLLRSANIYLRQGRLLGARKFLNVALRTAMNSGNRLLEAYTLLQLGHAYAGNPTEARKRYEAGAALTSHIGAPHANAYAQWCLGDFAAKQMRYDRALEHLRSAAASEDSALAVRDDDVLKDCETTAFGTLSPYDSLIELLLRLGKHEEAFVIGERRNRGQLFRALSGAEITTRDTALNTALRSFSVARRKYIGAERQLSVLWSDNTDSRALPANVQRSLTLHSARLRDIGDSVAAFNTQYRAALLVESANLSDVQAALTADAALVQFVPTSRALYALVVTNKQFSVELATVERPSLIALMNDYLDLLQQRAVDVEPSTAAALERQAALRSSQLYAFFLRPLESKLTDVKKLCVILPNNLPFIPIHSLKKPGSSNLFAIEQWEFRYLPDAAMLDQKRVAAKKPTAIAAFANRGRSSVDVAYEVNDLRAFAKNIQLSINADAETMVQLRGDALYLAADIQCNAERPDNAFLALAQRNALIEYEKIGTLFSLAPYATTVVSVLNNQPRHASIPRIIRMNGASNVVINLFLPMRKAKKMFNELFFTKLMSGESAERAYRAAIREMITMQEYKTPHLWAAFSLW